MVRTEKWVRRRNGRGGGMRMNDCLVEVSDLVV